MGEKEVSLFQRDSQGSPVGTARFPAHLTAYPVEVALLLDGATDTCHQKSEKYNSIAIGQYALYYWNQYIATGDRKYQEKFLIQAKWLVENVVPIDDTACAWPVIFSHPIARTGGPWLSALAQGCGLSVLVRAYQLTKEQVFIETAHRVVGIFERDILDGGVQSPLGGNGIFFEEIATYPASHQLSGCVFALLGLVDYVYLTQEIRIKQLIEQSLKTLQHFLEEFDLGYWTLASLLHRDLASPKHLQLQVILLDALAYSTGDTYYSILASRWRSYSRRGASIVRYKIAKGIHLLCVPWGRIRHLFFPRQESTQVMRVCIPIVGFPVTGGTRAVLKSISQQMQGLWQMEYLTQHVGSNTEGFVIHLFGSRRMGPWQFPFVWLYFLAGCWRLLGLLRRGSGYQIICPQDGVFTSAFAALAGKLAGVRVVCMDHGNLTLLRSPAYRVERVAALKRKNWSPLRYFLARLRYVCYWPSLLFLARISARYTDHFLIPGIAGDGVEEACQSLGIPASHITRFASTIDADHYTQLDPIARASRRQQNGIEAEGIVISIVCRLAPEKGLDTALEGIRCTLDRLRQDLRGRVRVVIAGDGPLRSYLEEQIHMRGLVQTVMLWGETSTSDIVSLLGMSDIFLYTSTRGACLSIAILEAMASACAVVASPLPMANISMLADGRGIIVPADDAKQTADALVRLVNDTELCRHMGQLARDYVKQHHNPAVFKRILLRTTLWPGLTTFLPAGWEAYDA